MFSQFECFAAFGNSCCAFELGFSDLELDMVVFEDVFHPVCECSFVAEVNFPFSYSEP